jgi:hypothetical protein
MSFTITLFFVKNKSLYVLFCYYWTVLVPYTSVKCMVQLLPDVPLKTLHSMSGWKRGDRNRDTFGIQKQGKVSNTTHTFVLKFFSHLRNSLIIIISRPHYRECSNISSQFFCYPMFPSFIT